MIEAPASPAPYRQDQAPWGVRDIATTLATIIVAMSAIFITLALVLRWMDISDERGSDARVTAILMLGQLLLNLSAVGIAAGFSLAKYRAPAAAWGMVRPIRLNAWPVISTLLSCYLALIVYGAATRALGIEALQPKENIEERLFDHPALIPLSVAFAVIVAPVTEEMFFRGFLFHGLWARLGYWGGTLLSGLAFGVIHVTSADKVGLIIPFTAIGVLFARLVAKTGSLWNAIATHLLFNGIALVAYFAAGR